MRAVVIEGPRDVRVVERPEPQLSAPTDAIVRIRATGICGSDLHIYNGHVKVEPGCVIGHEYVAEVVEVGAAVSELAVGDRVVGGFQTACGACWLCRRGNFHKCDRSRTFGHGALLGSLDGTQAEMALVPYADRSLRKVPESIPDEVALFAGDVLATGFHATTTVRRGDVVAVLGLGPVGLCAVQAAIVGGAAHVIAIDTVADRLALAERFGAVPVHLTEQSPRDEVKRITAGRGADLCVEAVGSAQALDLALRLAAKCATVNAVGVHAAPAEVNMGLAWIKSLTVTLGHANVLAHIDRVLELLACGRLDPRPLVTARMPLDEAAEAYARYARREALKIVLEP